MDAFISHSSADRARAARVEQTLEQDGLTVWFDRSEIRPGRLLRAELQGAIRDSRVIVLVWSKAAAKSRWVAAELLTALHSGRFVVAGTCDKTPLPYFLQNTIYLNLAARQTRWRDDLLRAVREAPRAANEVPPRIAAPTQELNETIRLLAEGQAIVTGNIGRDDPKARDTQAVLNPAMKAAEKRWRLEAMILNLAGYHHKNAYMLKHWDSIIAGQPPKDLLLDRAEKSFYKSLFANPYDYSALNGLGSILFYERDLDAAEFFIRRALALAKKDGQSYAAAERDLAMVLAWKARNRPAATQKPPRARPAAKRPRRP
jgi:tetratricopeptide (TPR) repeat protein